MSIEGMNRMLSIKPSFSEQRSVGCRDRLSRSADCVSSEEV
jgi:hypothetical protein